MRLALVVVLVALVAVPSAVASEEHPTSLEVQEELFCADCNTTLAEANALWYTGEAIGFIIDRIAAGDTKSEIKNKVAEKYPGHLIPIASERLTVADLGGEVMCPICNTTLDQSSSPAARQIKNFIAERIQAGDSKEQIKDRLVAVYGKQILAAPPKEGFDLLAWVLPFVGLVGGALALGFLAWRWSRRREPRPPSPALSPALERRVDEELARYDEG
jgi:cytochrome c-type biogenesis protein CcmH